MPPGSPISAEARARPPRRGVSWLAMVSLAAMWVHVWQHEVGHDEEEDGHFGPEVSEQCLLADSPPITLVTGSACLSPLARSSRRSAAGSELAELRRPPAFRIRAPPIAV